MTLNKLFGLGLGQTLSWGILYYAIFVLQKPMQADILWTTSICALGMGLAQLSNTLAAPLIGILLDRGYVRRIMLLGSLGGIVSLVIWASATSIFAFLFAMGLQGIALAACSYEPAFWVISKESPKKAVSFIGVLSIFGGLASPIFFPLTAALSTSLGWRNSLLILAVVLALALPLHFLLKAQYPRFTREKKAGPAIAPNTKGVFLLLQLAFVCTSLAAYSLPLLIIELLVLRGHSVTEAGALSGGLALCGILGRVFFSTLCARWSISRLMASFCLLPGAGVLALYFIPGWAGIISCLFVAGLGYGALWPGKAALIQTWWNGPRLGTISAWFSFIPNLFRSFSAALLAFLLLKGSLAAVLSVCIFSLAASACLYVIKPEPHPQQTQVDKTRTFHTQ